MRPTSCEISLSDVAHNVSTMAALVAPTPLCAVVKANGYGHGAFEIAHTALNAGASWLAVATAEEGAELRAAGIDAPIVVLSEQHQSSNVDLIDARLTPTVYTPAGAAALNEAAEGRGVIDVHVGLDTGMRRVGVEPDDFQDFLATVATMENLRVQAAWTHCPVADEPDNDFTEKQLARFDATVEPSALADHVGNSAVAITRPDRGAFMVRCGITIYGIDPDPALAGQVDIRPALTLKSAVTFVKPIAAGEAVGYGHRWTASEPTTIASVPIGYADGVRRDLGLRGGHVLIGGVRHPIVGVVTMDQIMVDVGSHQVAVGDEVVLIGSQGDDEIRAVDVAATLDTIPYEVVCAISERVPRRYV